MIKFCGNFDLSKRDKYVSRVHRPYPYKRNTIDPDATYPMGEYLKANPWIREWLVHAGIPESTIDRRIHGNYEPGLWWFKNSLDYPLKRYKFLVETLGTYPVGTRAWAKVNYQRRFLRATWYLSFTYFDYNPPDIKPIVFRRSFDE